MRRKTFIHALSCLSVVLMACGTAFAQSGKLQSGPYKGPMAPMAAPEAPAVPDAIFYSNLVVDPCTGFKYDTNNGFLLIGPNNCGIPGSTQWLAEPFISQGTGAVTKVMLSITNWGICTPTSTKFTVQIYDDACTGLPNNPLGSAVVANAANPPPALAKANFGTTGPFACRRKQVLGGSHDLKRSGPKRDDRSMVGGHYFHRALQLERWEWLAAWLSRRPGRFPSPITSDTDRILNRARADILRELVLFCANHVHARLKL